MLLTDENLHGVENIDATVEKERLQSSNLGNSDLPSSKITKEPVTTGKYHYL
jgi:hypothetical protein